MAVNQDDVIEASARIEFDGTEDVVNVFQFKKIDPDAESDSEAVDDLLEILEEIYDEVKVMLPVLATFEDVTLFNRTQLKPMGTFAWPNLTAGTAIGDPIPPGVSGMVSFATDIAKVNLKKYFGPITTAGNDSDGLLTTLVTDAITAAAALMLTLFTPTNGSWRYGYLSPKSLAFEVARGALVKVVASYQRRRKQGRGS